MQGDDVRVSTERFGTHTNIHSRQAENIICYEFKSDVYKCSGIKKAGLVDAAIELCQQARVNNASNAIQEMNENENNLSVDTSASDVANVTHV